MGRRPQLLRLAALLVGTSVVAAALFLVCCRFDNKYTAPGSQPVDGVLRLTEADLRAQPMRFLVRDWEIYRDRLLTPAEVAGGAIAPDELTFIGQYGGFEGGRQGASPHGSATYRLRLILPPETASYTLELPEIYSAYRLYINGTLMQQMGEPDPAAYRAQTGNTAVTVQAAGSLELLLAVSDYGYFYSGLVYPPGFGTPAAVSGYLNLRYGLRVAAVAGALCIGLIALLIHVIAKPLKDGAQDLILLYALLCFCFVGYIGYPVVKTLFPGGLGWYYLENFCYCGIFLLVGLVQQRISGWGGRGATAFVLLGLFVCCCALVVPGFLSGNLTLLLAYSGLLKLYTYAFALYLTWSTAYALFRGRGHSGLMAAGILVFDWALVFDRIYPHFEPILFGWFTELAAGMLVALIGVRMAGHIARQYQMRLVLEEQVGHAAHVLELQSAYYPILLEKEREAKAARHDLRHHVLMLRQLADQGNLAALVAYLEEYDLTYLQPGDTSYCGHYVVDMLLRLYAQRAKEAHISLTTRVLVPEELPVGNVDLCVIIGNLMENALEACRFLPEPERLVHIGLAYRLSRLSIAVDNRYDGWLQRQEGKLLSRKRGARTGVGLLSVEAVASRYGGSARFYSDGEAPVFHSEILLIARQTAPAAGAGGLEAEKGGGQPCK